MIGVCGAISNKLPAIYYGNQGWNMNQIQSFSSWVGKRPMVILLFTDWCNTSMNNLFNYQLNNIWNSGSIPAITWEPFGCGGSSQPAHEMNGNWYPWSMGSTPEDFVVAWRRIHDIFANKSLDSTRLQWIWCVSSVDVGNNTAERNWVGEDYVDWMGIDGYNFGTSQSWSSWLTPNQIFDNMITRLQNLSSTKPICINEYASTSMRIRNTPNITAKNEWLQQFCTYMNNKQIKMASYFNTDKETDWAIFGGVRGNDLWGNYSVYTAYRDCFQSSDWILPNSTNARFISDAQFAGTS
ncbi:unnamed protein product [Rotaria sordida]|uniref:GH26 domain-containing protein n=1 Tax=Rotaria sordida TaxID=392033 RepID=A0A819IT43_9BILA|nr:unnamed protein product [Rotaria sordida]